MFIVGSLEST